MEGPSLVLASEEMQAFCGKKILLARGNAKLELGLFEGQVVRDVFAWGKHLVWQFDTFALRIHFLMFGSYRAEVDGVDLQGDYVKPKSMEPRLGFTFENGEMSMYQCSAKILESIDAKSLYDFSVDTMRDVFDLKKAVSSTRKYPEEQIGDVLLNQEIFAGVGNIIRNEALYLQKIQPESLVGHLSDKQLRGVVKETLSYVQQFYVWRKSFELKQHFMVYRQKLCNGCGYTVTHKETGKRKRKSHFCEKEQVLY